MRPHAEDRASTATAPPWTRCFEARPEPTARASSACVLSGTLDDGTAGLRAIKAAGGLAVVQDPRGRAYPGMPSSAMQHVAWTTSPPPKTCGALVGRLTAQPAPAEPASANTEHS